MRNNRTQRAIDMLKRFGFRRVLIHWLLQVTKSERLDAPAIYQRLMKESNDIQWVGIVSSEKDLDKECLNAEVSELLRLLKKCSESARLPSNWNSGIGTCKFLFELIRDKKFTRVLEIGTGNGLSCLAIYQALNLNCKKFSFVTVDVSDLSGSILDKEIRSIVDFRIIEHSLKAKKEFFAEISNLMPELVFIDGAHDYLNVINDLELAFGLDPLIIIADDVEVNEAWQDFCRTRNLKYSIILDGRKVLAMIDLTDES